MNSRSNPRVVLRPGDPFNPWKQFDFNLQVPLWLYRFTTVRDRIASRPNDKPQPLSDSAKLLYGRLIYYGGRNAHCFPLIQTLADERGVSVSTIKRCVQELVDYKLIRVERKGPHSADFKFLVPQALSGSHEDSSKLGCLENQTAESCTEDSSTLSGLDSSKLGAPNKEEKIQRKDSLKRASGKATGIVQKIELPPARLSPSSMQENEAPPGTPVARSKPDASEKRPDREISSGEGHELQVTDHDAKLIEAVLAVHHIKILPDGIVRELLKAAALEGANVLGLADFIEYKCTSAYNSKSDRVEVASFFRKAIPEDMPSWIARNGGLLFRRGGLIRPGTCSPTNETPEIREARQPSEETENSKSGVRAYWDERHKKQMETPVPPADAIRILNFEFRGWKAAAPQPFLSLVERKFSEICPVELLAARSAWRTCRRCGDSGIIGSSLRRTLNFCECEIGQQEHLDRGDDYVAYEIERVNATLKSRLVQACREVKRDFIGDAIAQDDTKVTEYNDLIEIHPGKGAENWCYQGELRPALEYLGESRPVRVARVTKIGHSPPRPLTKSITQDDVDHAVAEHRCQDPARREPVTARLFGSQSDSAAANYRR